LWVRSKHPLVKARGTPCLDKGSPLPWQGVHPLVKARPPPCQGKGVSLALTRGSPLPWQGGLALTRGTPCLDKGGDTRGARTPPCQGKGVGRYTRGARAPPCQGKGVVPPCQGKSPWGPQKRRAARGSERPPRSPRSRAWGPPPHRGGASPPRGRGTRAPPLVPPWPKATGQLSPALVQWWESRLGYARYPVYPPDPTLASSRPSGAARAPRDDQPGGWWGEALTCRRPSHARSSGRLGSRGAMGARRVGDTTPYFFCTSCAVHPLCGRGPQENMESAQIDPITPALPAAQMNPGAQMNPVRPNVPCPVRKVCCPLAKFVGPRRTLRPARDLSSPRWTLAPSQD